MEKQYITALLVILLLAPLTGLEAKSRHYYSDDRDDDAGERDDDDAKKSHYSSRYSRHKKYKKPRRYKNPGYLQAIKAELELLNRAVLDINMRLEVLESKGGEVPADLEMTLRDLRADVELNKENIGINESGITMNMDDIIDINAIIPEILNRLDSLENPPFSGVIFSGVFNANDAPDEATKSAWMNFRNNDAGTGPFSSIEIRNSLGGSVKCENSDAASEIATALNTFDGSLTSTKCGSLWWNVGLASGLDAELNASLTKGVEGCDAKASVRPVVFHENWGGVGITCGAQSQTLEVLLER